MSDEAGRQRVVIEGVEPEIDGGRFPIKRVVGERVVVEADIYTDGTDALSCRLLYRGPEDKTWSQVPLQAVGDDRWRGELTVTGPGRWRYTVTGWVDPFKTWRRDLPKRSEAGRDPAADLPAGVALIRQAGRRAEAAGRRADARVLAGFAAELEAGTDPQARLRRAQDGELAALMERLADRRFASYHRELEVVVDRERARGSAWYEMPPRPAGAEGRHSLWKDAEARLPEVAAMGFDVLALPPFPLSGRTAPGFAEEARLFLDKAREHGLEVALDLAWPVAPEPAEPEAWRAEWQELKSTVDHWVARGVRIFRSSDPQTRTFPFWEWLLTAVKREHPDVLFLAGGLQRPKPSARLAKLGFTWSAADIPWQGSKDELTARFLDVATGRLSETLRPHLGLSPEGDRTVFAQRLILAAILGASYGLQGSAFELPEDAPGEDGLAELIGRVHRIRHENPALQTDLGLCFHRADHPQILCFSKVDATGDNVILVVVNLEPRQTQSAWLELDVEALGVPNDRPYEVHDLLTKVRYLWHGSRNFVQLDSQALPAQIFRVRRRA